MSGDANGTWLALLGVGVVCAAGVVTKRGSRAPVPIAELTVDQLGLLSDWYNAWGDAQVAQIEARLGVDPHDYAEEDIRREQNRRKYVILGQLFGGNVGSNADWIDNAWHIGPSHTPNRVGGDYYVIEDEDEDDSWRILRRWHVGEPQEQAAAKAAAQAAGQQFDGYNDYIQEVAAFTSFEVLLAHLRVNIDTYRPRIWIGRSQPQR